MQKIDTIAYYDSHAGNFFSDTQRVDMAPIYQRFLPHLPRGAHILDAGCGSGRDSKAFLARGYRVTAFDASLKLVELAQAHTGLPIAQRRFEDVDEVSIYDGIWACASLLHLPESELVPTLQRLWRALKPSGVFYLSFKYGESEREHQGRHFTDATESRLTHWLKLKRLRFYPSRRRGYGKPSICPTSMTYVLPVAISAPVPLKYWNIGLYPFLTVNSIRHGISSRGRLATQ